MIDFAKGNIKNISKILKSSFERLPADTNEKSKGYYFRYRRFSKVISKNNKILKIKDNSFFQNKKINRFAGGKIRIFKPIEKKILNSFLILFKDNFKNFFFNKKIIELGFHQLRIKCSKNFVGYPVPEGWHKDGYDYVIIVNFQSKGISGGITRIKIDIDSSSDIYSSFLKSGDYILISDKKYFHYTDPINVSGLNNNGYRDTLVITIKL